MVPGVFHRLPCRTALDHFHGPRMATNLFPHACRGVLFRRIANDQGAGCVGPRAQGYYETIEHAACRFQGAFFENEDNFLVMDQQGELARIFSVNDVRSLLSGAGIGQLVVRR
jgi:hypothetical protein